MPVRVEGFPVEIEVNTVVRAIKKLKNRKASGVGGIKAEMIKNGTEKLMRRIRSLINMCIRKGQVPEEWKTGYVFVA